MGSKSKKTSTRGIIAKDFRRNKYIYLMLIPVLAYFIIFAYIPMYGIIIAFKDFTPGSIFGGEWVGLKHFQAFFSSAYAVRTIKNTLLLNFYLILFGFPAPILLALLLNEVKNKVFKSTVQTISYLPHFISMVVICGIIIDFTSSAGIINKIISIFTGFQGQSESLLNDPAKFRPIYVATDIWQGIGWGTIIYLAAFTAIDPELYDAAKVDGAGRFRLISTVTLPGIMPTIIIMFILRIGGIMSLGFEKIILLYSPATYETADVISSYVYRRGLQDFDYSFSAAVGLFNSLVNLIFLVGANFMAKRFSETSLW